MSRNQSHAHTPEPSERSVTCRQASSREDRGCELVNDEGTKQIGTVSRVNGNESTETVECQRTDHGGRLPRALNPLAGRLLAADRPTINWRRAEAEPLIVEEDLASRVEVGLAFDERFAPCSDVFEVTLVCERLFFCVHPMARIAFHMPPMLAVRSLQSRHASIVSRRSASELFYA